MAKRRGGYTKHRDGWVRWYRGKTRFVAGHGADPADLDDLWLAKKRNIDAGLAADIGTLADDGHTAGRTYREVLTEFLAGLHKRIGAVRKPISERTFRNYQTDLNAFGRFAFGGLTIADMDIKDISPVHFSAYAATFAKWKASGFDTIVVRVSALFRWAIGMEYIDRFRPGPDFVRPSKAQIRSDRVAKTMSYTTDEVAKLWLTAGHTQRCWIALGICAGFNNSDIANVTRDVIDLAGGVIDFRRRKTGKIRRVIPLPSDVVELLRGYGRPDPGRPEWADLFFLSQRGGGRPYSRVRDESGKPSCSISRLFGKLITKTEGVATVQGRNFKGLRTTFYNLAPRVGYELERKIIMGHARGAVDLDSYLEDVGIDRLRHVVHHVWDQIKSAISSSRTDFHQLSPVSPSPSIEPEGAD